MISPQDIRTVTFEKAMRGYRPEDVDAFLQQTAQDVETLTSEKAELQQKLYILAQKIEDYRKDEDNLKTALLNAQRMGENVIREAKQKAEGILRQARISAEDITRQATDEVQEEKLELERVTAEVAHFKASVLSLYKQHIESLSTLPGEEGEETQPVETSEHEDEIPAMVDEPLVVEHQAEPEAMENVPVSEQPAAPQPAFEEPEAWVKQEEAPMEELGQEIDFGAQFPAEPAQPEQEADMPGFDGFQGIKFSD